jgi:FlaA1/EpsC-like NDP-sugar epimerase
MTHDLSDPLLARLLKRDRSLLASDVEANRAAIEDAIRGKRLLIAGAAGSIGASFARLVAGYGPKALHLADLNENNLVELMRDLRSSDLALPEDLKSFSVDFAQADFAKMAGAFGPYDAFLNFSALKHVRAERDPYSLMRMVEVNVLAVASWLDSPPARRIPRLFSVSTDKSVRPENLMGATKNLMERILFAKSGRAICSSARFANVAFSAGSLLDGFENRFAKGQPIAAPNDVKRYFITHGEAGELCLLAAFLSHSREVFFPKLDAKADLIGFDDIATAFLAGHGLEPLICQSEDEAKARMKDRPAKLWPCVFAPSDTTGEKSEEEFHRLSDKLDLARFKAAGVASEAKPDEAVLDAFMLEIRRIRKGRSWSKEDIAQALMIAVPELVHVERGISLDQKM